MLQRSKKTEGLYPLTSHSVYTAFPVQVATRTNAVQAFPLGKVDFVFGLSENKRRMRAARRRRA